MAKQRNTPSAGRQVNQLVAGLDVESASRDDVAALAETICALGHTGVEALARGILRPGPARREKVTALLACLRGEAAAWAFAQVEKLLDSRRLSSMERVWLLTTARRLHEATLPDGAAAPAHGAPPPRVEPAPLDATELMLWREDLAELPPHERLSALAPVLESGEVALLPVLEVALSLGDRVLEAAVAEGLVRFPTAEALPLLRDLLRSPDVVVRRRARDSLVAFARRGIARRDLFVADPAGQEAGAFAFAGAPDVVGRVAVVVGWRRGDGLVDYVFVLVDPVGVGILDAWGDASLTERELGPRLAQLMAETGSDVDPVELDVARGLVAGGEAFARARGAELPAEYLIWRRRIGRPTGRPRLPVVFGPKCAECGTSLDIEDLEHGGILAGKLALCALCAEEPRPCAGCGQPLHAMLDEFALRPSEDSQRLVFVCTSCQRGRRRRRRHPRGTK